MKISTITSAQEMAIQTPKSDELAAIKAIIPNANQFPLPTPSEVLDRYYKYSDDSGFVASDSFYSFVSGYKKKGKGVAIASYPMLYNKAIVPLQTLWEIKEDNQAIIDYLMENPIKYRKDRDPEVDCYFSNGLLNEALYLAFCVSNLMDWLYLSSEPAYQYLRENLLEKARFFRKKFSEKTAYGIRVLPQRTRTSRNMGENETNLYRINAGYRFTSTVDPFTGDANVIGELVTWFFTNSRTEKLLFKDYVDVEDASTDDAIRKIAKSELYVKWAEQMSPAEYARACNAFRVPSDKLEEEIKGLTILRGTLTD